MPTATLPDVKALAIHHLGVIAGLAGGRVFGKFPTNPTYPLMRVRRIGGVPPDPRWLDAATLQIDVWADTEDASHDVAAAAVASIQDAVGVIDTGTVSGTITGVEVTQGVHEFPDEVRVKERHTATVLVYAHP